MMNMRFAYGEHEGKRRRPFSDNGNNVRFHSLLSIFAISQKKTHNKVSFGSYYLHLQTLFIISSRK